MQSFRAGKLAGALKHHLSGWFAQGSNRLHCWKSGLERWWVIIVWLALLLAVGCTTEQVAGPPLRREPGQASIAEDVFGNFYSYIPTSLSPDTDIVVLIHGTPMEGVSAEETAQYYVANWVDFAEKHDLLLIVPAFNQEDFSSRIGDHALGGYRGLLGREIMADDWVLRLVKAYQQEFHLANRQFYLYGHSAGGQFTGRFLVTHPDQVKRAVISSAATYPQPNPEIAWPFGMGALDTEIEWDADTTRQVKIVPDKQTWLAATQVPLVVMVGLNDTSELPAYPGQKGKVRYVIGRNWVKDMEQFAQENGLASNFSLELIPGKGHSMYNLIPNVQDALILRQNP